MMAKEKRHNSLILVPCASTPATNACTSVIRRMLLSGRSHSKVQRGEGEGEEEGEEEERRRRRGRRRGCGIGFIFIFIYL